MTVRIDLATPEDTAPFTACILAAYAAYEASGISLPPVAEGVAEDIELGRVWMARENGNLLGGLVVSQDATSTKIHNLAIHPDHHGRGLGRLLVAKAVDLARDNRCSSVSLVTHADIPSNVALYEHLGFKVVHRDGDKIQMTMTLS